MTPEKRVQNSIIKFLDSVKRKDGTLLYFRRQAGGFSYKDGLPDLWVLYHGLHLEVEVKAVGGSPDPLQLKWEDRFKKAGALYWRGNSATDFEEFFNERFATL